MDQPRNLSDVALRLAFSPSPPRGPRRDDDPAATVARLAMRTRTAIQGIPKKADPSARMAADILGQVAAAATRGLNAGQARRAATVLRNLLDAVERACQHGFTFPSGSTRLLFFAVPLAQALRLSVPERVRFCFFSAVQHAIFSCSAPDLDSMDLELGVFSRGHPQRRFAPALGARSTMFLRGSSSRCSRVGPAALSMNTIIHRR